MLKVQPHARPPRPPFEDERTPGQWRSAPLREGGRRATANVADQTYRALLDAITHFELPPGSEISEGKLAEQLGVSRTPVREALSRLAKLHLVDIYPQRGTIVAPLRMAELHRSQFLRESLEIGLIRRAIKSPSRRTLVAALQNELAVQETFARIGDQDRFYVSDETLHRLISEHAGLEGIWQDIAEAKVHMDRFRHLTLASVEALPTILEQHRDIVNAVADADEARAEASLKRHLRRIFEFIEPAFDAKPEYFEKSWDGRAFFKGLAD